MLVICPNPTVDRQLFLTSLTLGSVARTRSNRAFPGGKPIDVLRAAKAHGAAGELHCLLPQDGTEWYVDALAAEGLPVVAHRVPGVVRETVVLYEDSGRVTVINGAGTEVSAEDWQAFADAVVERVTPAGWVVCSGSFPPGVTEAQVLDLVTRVGERGGRLALDTGPQWLSVALPGRPYLVTPNLAEAESALTGRPATESVEVGPDALAAAEAAAGRLHRAGVPQVVVTAGAAGLAWASEDGAGHLAGLDVEVVNPIGAGDAFLGGLVSRLEAGDRFADAVGWGLATAASAIEQWVPGAADAERTRRHHERLVTR